MNKKINKKMTALVMGTILLLGTFLTGCTPKEAASTKTEGQSEKTLRYAVWTSPKGIFNPSIYDDVYDGKVNRLVYETLMTLNEKSEFVPALAEKYDVSQDNLTLTFYLDKKAKFQDDKPVTAEDVEFTFTTICSNDYKGPRFAEIGNIQGAQEYHDKKADKVSGINIIDDNTISFTFSEAYASGLFNICNRGILPKHVWEDIPVADWAKSTELLNNPVGSGPYKLVKFVPDQYIELEKYKDFNLGQPNIDKIIFKVSNQDTAQSELIKGDLDLVMMDSLKKKDVDAYKEAGVNIKEYPSQGYQYMGLNLRRPIFSDKKVRQALMYAIDRRGIVDNLMEGHGTIVNTPMVESSWAFPDKSTLTSYDYNKDKAKELLKEAGWIEKDGLLYKDGKPFEVTLKYPIGNKLREQSAPIIQQNLKDVGIKVNLQNMEMGTLKEQVIDNQDFDMYLLGWSLEADPDSKAYWHSSVSNKGGWNIVGFVNAQNDKLLEEGTKTFDMNKRKEIYGQWLKLMNDEVPAVFLYSQNEGRAYTKNLENYTPSTFEEYININKWSIK